MVITSEHDCQYKAELAALRAEVKALKRLVYGKKSEKQPRAPKLTPPADPAATKQKRQQNAAAKQALPELRIEHPVPDDHKTCRSLPTTCRPPDPKTSPFAPPRPWDGVAEPPSRRQNRRICPAFCLLTRRNTPSRVRLTAVSRCFAADAGSFGQGANGGGP